MAGDEVRQIFEVILLQEAIDRLSQQCSVIERERAQPRDVRAGDSDLGRNAGWRLSGGRPARKICRRAIRQNVTP